MLANISNIDSILAALTNICQNLFLFPNTCLEKTLAASLTRRKHRLGLPTHIKRTWTFINIGHCTILVLSRALCRALYCPVYCRFSGYRYTVKIQKATLVRNGALYTCRPTRAKLQQKMLQKQYRCMHHKAVNT